jgi:hypothetical protein
MVQTNKRVNDLGDLTFRIETNGYIPAGRGIQIIFPEELELQGSVSKHSEFLKDNSSGLKESRM